MNRYLVRDEDGMALWVFWNKDEAESWALPGYAVSVEKATKPDWYTLMLAEVGEAML